MHAILLFLCLCTSIHAESLRGVARQNGKDLYVEEVQIAREDGRIKTSSTRFLSMDGKLLAEMKSTASMNPYVPDVEFTDQRDGYAYTLKSVGSGTVQIRIKESVDKAWETQAPMSLGKDTIIIQSVLDFANDHLAELRAHDHVDAQFLVPSKNRQFGMRVTLLKPFGPSPAAVADLRIQSSHWVLRHTVFPEFSVQYDIVKNHIVKFTGISTIMAELGAIEMSYTAGADK